MWTIHICSGARRYCEQTETAIWTQNKNIIDTTIRYFCIKFSFFFKFSAFLFGSINQIPHIASVHEPIIWLLKFLQYFHMGNCDDAHKEIRCKRDRLSWMRAHKKLSLCHGSWYNRIKCTACRLKVPVRAWLLTCQKKNTQQKCNQNRYQRKSKRHTSKSIQMTSTMNWIRLDECQQSIFYWINDQQWLQIFCFHFLTHVNSLHFKTMHRSKYIDWSTVTTSGQFWLKQFF